MIVKWFLELIASFLNWLLSLLPTFEIPSWMGDVAGVVGMVFGFADSMSAWFPGPLVLTVVLTVLSVWAVSFAIKIARIVASFFTAGGGSAA